uniref:PGG domain-containing protein n=1 Tax=Quercus lobata TaxID=97700 RepID=A0A7N2LFV6_QUELO
MASCFLFRRSESCFIDFQYNPKEDKAGDVRNILLVVATLIAAVTFQAGVNPPGGVWQDNMKRNHTLCDEKSNQGRPFDPSCDIIHAAGTAIFASRVPDFYVFLLFNTVALSTSVLVIMSLTYKFPFHLEVLIATASMLATYASAVFAVTPADYSSKSRFLLIVAALPFVLRVLIYMVKFRAYADREQENLCDKCRSGNFCRKCRDEIPKKDVGSDQLPK